jgi:hypothetical protein
VGVLVAEGICCCLDGGGKAGVFGSGKEGIAKEGVFWVAAPYKYRVLKCIIFRYCLIDGEDNHLPIKRRREAYLGALESHRQPG